MRWLRTWWRSSSPALAEFLRAESGVTYLPVERPVAPVYTERGFREPEEFIAPEPWVPEVVTRPVWVPAPPVLNLQPRRVQWTRRVVEKVVPAEVVAALFIAEFERDPTLRYLTDITDCTKIIHEFPRS